jgi:hypothetical protein
MRGIKPKIHFLFTTGKEEQMPDSYLLKKINSLLSFKFALIFWSNIAISTTPKSQDLCQIKSAY